MANRSLVSTALLAALLLQCAIGGAMAQTRTEIKNPIERPIIEVKPITEIVTGPPKVLTPGDHLFGDVYALCKTKCDALLPGEEVGPTADWAYCHCTCMNEQKQLLAADPSLYQAVGAHIAETTFCQFEG